MTVAAMSGFAQKTIYIPNEWRYFNSNDTLLYAENDPDNKYTWSKSRSVETDNFIIFWDKGWGNTAPDKLPSSNFYYFDLTYMKERLETFYKDEREKLGFGGHPNTNINKYKIMVLLNHTTEWTCYGGGYDFQVPALWINPSTSKPVGSAVAHEVGHSFHYMCYADASKQGSDSSVQTGFHGAVGNGATIWETTANWQALATYPNEIFTESSTYYHFYNTHNYAFSHEWHRYQAYMFLFYLCEYYNDLKTVYNVWSYPETKVKDFNEVLMDYKGLTPAELYKLHFDFAMHAVTYDIEACKPYLDDFYIGNFRYAAVEIADKTFQVAYSSCPQGTGFNVIPLQVQPAGTEITTTFTAMKVLSKLASGDPAEYHNGDDFTASGRTYYNGKNASYRGFRLGYVVLKNDGTREYIADDEVYCTGSGEKSVDVKFTVPENTKRMWLVVAPSLSNYVQHKWDDNIANDDQWPYYFHLEGTDIGSNAIVYSAPTIDEREVADIEFEYDVYFPANSSQYTGITVAVERQAAAAFGTAFQMATPTTDLSNAMENWKTGVIAEGKARFYALNPTTGNQVNAGYTTNTSGHWFNASGNRTTYSNGDAVIYSDFTPSSLSFYIGQYPGKVKNGEDYRIGQAIRYKKNGKIAMAKFFFNVHVNASKSGAELKSIQYDDPTGILDISAEPASYNSDKTNVYSISGQLLKRQVDLRSATESLPAGIYIINGKKVMITR